MVPLPVFDATNALNGTNGEYHMGFYAAFYVTGWARNTGGGWKQDCAAQPIGPNDPVPAGLAAKSGGVAMWGHYIKYVPPGDTPGPTRCLDPGNNVIPCVPGLVR